MAVSRAAALVALAVDTTHRLVVSVRGCASLQAPVQARDACVVAVAATTALATALMGHLGAAPAQGLALVAICLAVLAANRLKH